MTVVTEVVIDDFYFVVSRVDGKFEVRFPAYVTDPVTLQYVVAGPSTVGPHVHDGDVRDSPVWETMGEALAFIHGHQIGVQDL